MGGYKKDFNHAAVIVILFAMLTVTLTASGLEDKRDEITLGLLTGMAIAGIAIYFNGVINGYAALSSLEAFWKSHLANLEEEGGVYTYGLLRDTTQNLLAVYPIAVSAQRRYSTWYMDTIQYLQRVTRDGDGRVPGEVESDARLMLEGLAADALLRD